MSSRQKPPRSFRAIELEVLSSGHPAIDRERSVVTSSGLKKWLASTTAPLVPTGWRRFRPNWRRPRHHRTQGCARRSGRAPFAASPDRPVARQSFDQGCRKPLPHRQPGDRRADRRRAARGPDRQDRFQVLPKDLAQKFFDDEQTVVRTGQSMIDIEEYVFDGSGGKTWY